jgi:hypothetical protein
MHACFGKGCEATFEDFMTAKIRQVAVFGAKTTRNGTLARSFAKAQLPGRQTATNTPGETPWTRH